MCGSRPYASGALQMVKRKRGESPAASSSTAAGSGGGAGGIRQAAAATAGDGDVGRVQAMAPADAIGATSALDATAGGSSSSAVPNTVGKGGKSKARGRKTSFDEASTSDWLEKIRKQVDFYFSDANLRRDKFLQKKLKEGEDFVELKTILQFNRIHALKCRKLADLACAIQRSSMLVLSEDKKKVGRAKAPIKDVDTVPLTVYVEGVPLKLSIDDLTAFFARHGVVHLVDRPRHPQTREPLGHCFVEYASAREAEVAVAALNGYWDPTWPRRQDCCKVLRALPKQRFLEHKRDFKALRQASRGATSSAASSSTSSRPGVATTAGARAPTDTASDANSSVANGGAAAADGAASGAPTMQAAFQEPGDSASGVARGASSVLAAPNVANAREPKVMDTGTGGAASSAAAVADTIVVGDDAGQGSTPLTSAPSSVPSYKRRGCVVRVSGFPDPQTRLSIRQFVEHAVPVDYCDFETGCSWAHLTLRTAEDCRTLLEDLRLTRRLLGWLRPQVAVLGPEEEEKYWKEVGARRAARDASSEAPSSKKARRRQALAEHKLVQKIRWNPQGVISGGQTKQSTLKHWGGEEALRWRGVEHSSPVLVASPAPADQDKAATATAAADTTVGGASGASCSFVDTVAGNGGFVQAGFGAQRRGRDRFKPKERPVRPALASSSVPPPVPPLGNSSAPPPRPPPPFVPVVSAATAPAPAPSPTIMPPPRIRLPGGPPTKVPRVAPASNQALSSSAFADLPALGASDAESDLSFMPVPLPPLPPPSPACPGAFPKRTTLKGAKAKKLGAPPRSIPPLAPWTPGSGGSGAGARGQRREIDKTAPLSLLPPPSPFAVHARRASPEKGMRMPPQSPLLEDPTGVQAGGTSTAPSASDGPTAAANAGAEMAASEVPLVNTQAEASPVLDSMLEEAEDILSLF